jgi:hypothetical protein
MTDDKLVKIVRDSRLTSKRSSGRPRKEWKEILAFAKRIFFSVFELWTLKDNVFFIWLNRFIFILYLKSRF